MRKTYIIMLLILCAALMLCASAENTPSAPVFSLPGGFYDEAVSLEMTSPDGYEIRYTTDATDPARMKSAFTYRLPVTIENTDAQPNGISAKRDITLEWYMAPMYNVPKCTVVRAVCIAPDGTASAETAATYFIGRTEEYYSQMGTISLITEGVNLFGSVEGIFAIGQGYETWKNSDEYTQYTSPSDPRYPTNYNRRGRDWERPATIQVFKNGQQVLNQAIGIRVSGNYSRGNAQKSLTFYARKEYGKGKMKCDFFDGRCLDINGEPITEFDRVTIRNGGNDYAGVRFRDDLNQELMGQTNLSVQAKQPYIVYINGEFWGMYTMQEKEDKHYVASHFGVDKDNVTIIKCGKLEDGSEDVMEEYREFYEWALEADFSEPENYARFADTIDIDGFIDLFAGESYVSNYDFAVIVNNWSIWRVNEPDGSAYGDGKWRFMVYDTEYSLGLYDQLQTAYDYDYLNEMDIYNEELALPVLLFNIVMDNGEFRGRFYSRYVELMDTVYAYENVVPIIDRLVDTQQKACLDTMRRFSVTWNDYYGEVGKIKEFFTCRREYALESLESFCSD